VSGPLSPETLGVLSARIAAALGLPVVAATELLENPENLEYIDMLLRVESVARARASPLLGEFLEAAVPIFEKEPFVASALLAMPESRPELAAVVQKVAGGTKSQAHALGAFLRANMGRSVNGWHIEQVGDRRGSVLWALVPAE
jgi:hypothetical protein